MEHTGSRSRFVVRIEPVVIDVQASPSSIVPPNWWPGNLDKLRSRVDGEFTFAGALVSKSNTNVNNRKRMRFREGTELKRKAAGPLLAPPPSSKVLGHL